MALSPCTYCHRHVRSTERVCPFCAAPTTSLASRSSPTERLGRAALAAFGAAAVSTTLGACGARGGLEIGPPVQIVDAGSDADLGCCSADYGGPPAPVRDAGVDSGTFIGAYGAPPPPDPRDGGPPPDGGPLGEDAGGTFAEYGGPPAP